MKCNCKDILESKRNAFENRNQDEAGRKKREFHVRSSEHFHAQVLWYVLEQFRSCMPMHAHAMCMSFYQGKMVDVREARTIFLCWLWSICSVWWKSSECTWWLTVDYVD